MNIILRDYQNDIIEITRNNYKKGYKFPLVVAPTGSGKTIIFSSITEQSVRLGKRVLVLVHRVELLYQTSNKLDLLGLEHGLISPEFTPALNYQCQIASVYTLARRLDKIIPPDLIIIDEAHHATAETWSKIIKFFPKARLIGFTATPERLDGKGLGIAAGGFFDVLVNKYDMDYMIKNNFLVNFKYYAPENGLNFESIPMQCGDYNKGLLYKELAKPQITGDAIAHYKKLGNNMPAIAFCVNIEHAKQVAMDFTTAGIPAESIDGKLSNEVRKERLKNLEEGRIKVLTSCDLISEGTDIPCVGVGILLRPTQSTSLFLQQCGRILRLYPNKEYAVILDHVGNYERHGLPDSPRDWNLNGVIRGKTQQKDKKTYKICKNCDRVLDIKAIICFACGYKPEPEIKKITIKDGDLKQITTHEIKKKRFSDTDGKKISRLIKECVKMGLSKSAAYKIYHRSKIKNE